MKNKQPELLPSPDYVKARQNARRKIYARLYDKEPAPVQQAIRIYDPAEEPLPKRKIILEEE